MTQEELIKLKLECLKIVSGNIHGKDSQYTLLERANIIYNWILQKDINNGK